MSNIISNGTGPTILDKRDLSYHRTFGAAVIPTKFPSEFILDSGKTMPDQMVDGLPFGCTGYTQADNATDSDKTIYKPYFTYEKTCFIEGHPTNQGCDIRTSLKTTRVYGLQALAEATDKEATAHRRGKYFNIYDDGPTDWFDSMRTALIANNEAISVGTPWPGEWAVTNNGIVTKYFTYDGKPEKAIWHNWSIKGWKDINGEPYLIGKSWQGSDYGDKGFHYLDRDTTNKIMEIRGSVAFISLKVSPQDVYTIQLDIYQTVLLFLYRILGILRPLN